MKPIMTRFILLFLMGVYTPTIMAVPVVAIDLDSGTAGIQSSLSVLTGTVLSASLVAYDDGTGMPSLIATVGTDITSSSSAVASLGLTATAGSFANLLVSAVDIFTIPFAPATVSLGTILTTNPFGAPATSASSGSIGYLDLAGVGASLPGIASFIDLINFSITAGSVGSSIISTDAGSLSAPPGGSVFPFLATAELTVTSPGGGGTITNIPEPSILFLMALGLLSFPARRIFNSVRG